jgi:hypothetical protein
MPKGGKLPPGLGGNLDAPTTNPVYSMTGWIYFTLAGLLYLLAMAVEQWWSE